MSSFQHIGQDFTTKAKLNLIPGVKIPRNTYQVTIQYLTHTNGMITMHNQSMIADSRDLNVIVGQDVREITVQIASLAVSSVTPIQSHYHYQMRIDRLILLNIAAKLLKSRL